MPRRRVRRTRARPGRAGSAAVPVPARRSPRPRWSSADSQRRRLTREEHVEQATAPALSSGSLPLPHFGDCTHDGQPSRTRRTRSLRVASATRRSRPAALGEPGAARVPVVARRRSGAPVSGCSAVETPPMSQRSHVANKRQQPDRGVLGGVRGAGQRRPAPISAAREPVVGDRPPHRPGPQLSRTGRSSGSSPSTSPVPSRRRRKDDDLAG